MLSPAFLAAAPPALPSAPAAPGDHSEAPPTGKRPDDPSGFADELQSALAGNPPQQPVANSPQSSATSHTPAPADKTTSEKFDTTNAVKPATNPTAVPAKSVESILPTVPDSPPGTAGTPQPAPASPSPAPTATLLSTPVTPAPTAPIVTKPAVAAIPTNIPTAVVPTTSAGNAAKVEAIATVSHGPSANTTVVNIETPKAPGVTGTAPTAAKGETPTPSRPSFAQQTTAAVNGDSGSSPATSAVAAQVMVTAATITASPRSDPGPTHPAPAHAGSPPAVVSVPTTAPSTPSTSAVRPTPSVSEQIGSAILARIETSPTSGRIDFHLSLNPPELGPVRVQLTLTNQTLSARLVANDSATQQLIQNQMDALRQRLQETGLSLGQLDVSSGGSGDHRHQPLLPFPDLGDGRSVPLSTIATPLVSRTTTGTIDLVA